jgi:hypothetical protein
MPADAKFAVYLSHSWRTRDVELNARVWNEVESACELLVDAPETSGADPPYYINRIEEQLRRSDLFLCVLTQRDQEATGAAAEPPLQCSAYSLFEIRLAQRFDIPLLVLYERSTGFKSPRSLRPNERYIAFDRGRSGSLPDERAWRTAIAPKMQEWVRWACDDRKPATYEPSSVAVGLIPPKARDGGAVREQIKDQLRAAGYERVSCKTAFAGNVDAFQILHAAGLVVADVSDRDPVAVELYAAAHALGIPAIRLIRTDAADAPLPWLLDGHPGGYQHDLVRWAAPNDLAGQLEPRARAMFRIVRALAPADARRYLQSKRYSDCCVFISHTLKPPRRDLVKSIYAMLSERYVTPFEYHIVNAAGDHWKVELEAQLQKTTHLIVLLSDEYEQSPVCTYEMEAILGRLNRGDAVKIFPFMIDGRSRPHPKLGELGLHHRLLDAPEINANATVVADEVMAVLERGASPSS